MSEPRKPNGLVAIAVPARARRISVGLFLASMSALAMDYERDAYKRFAVICSPKSTRLVTATQTDPSLRRNMPPAEHVFQCVKFFLTVDYAKPTRAEPQVR